MYLTIQHGSGLMLFHIVGNDMKPVFFHITYGTHNTSCSYIQAENQFIVVFINFRHLNLHIGAMNCVSIPESAAPSQIPKYRVILTQIS